MKLTVIRNRRLFSDPNFGPETTKHTSAGNRRFIGLASSGPSGRRAIPVRILVMASNLGGALQNFGAHDIPRHTPDGSELSTFFLDPRRPLHPLHQSFTYEPKQILWHLKSKPLGTAQISTAWFVAFYDPWIPWILLQSHVVICYRLEWLEEAPKIALHWRKHNDTLFRDSPAISRRLLSTVRIHGVPCGPFFHELIPSLYHHCLFTMHKAG